MGQLPGATTGTDDRVVCHVDIDCFYAACERLREPELEGEPVVVGMGYEPGTDRGAVATASYEARAHGVESAMAISTALDRLPRVADARENPDADVEAAGHYRPVDMDHYEDVAADVKSVLHDEAATVKEVSVDEAYLAAPVDWPGARAFARSLRERIDDEVGVTASVGVAPNMATAKVASDHDKPDGLVVVEPGEARSFLAPLSVEELHGVGPVTARSLRDLGVETAGDLAEREVAELVERFGQRGREIHERARGIDERAVEPVGDPKSLSSESAFVGATDATAEKRERIRTLAADVADRARAKGALYRTIGIKVVRPPFDVNTRERSLPGPVRDSGLVESVALDLLSEFEDATVRKLGVRVSNLSFAAADQASLSAWARDGGAGDGEAADARLGADGGTLDSTVRRGQSRLGEFTDE